MKITYYPRYFIRRLFVKGKHSFYSAGYKCMYPEYSRHGMTPWQHYVLEGKRKGFDNGNHPSEAVFFCEGYETEYPDIIACAEDAWHHYAEIGFAEGRDNGLHPKADTFFPEGYLWMYHDIADAGIDPWHHYSLIGKKEGRDNGLNPTENTFFPEGYLLIYPDVAESGMDPWHHYVLLGFKEGRDNGLHPSGDLFFPDGYLFMYPCAAESGMDPWHHYALVGKKRGYDSGLHPKEDMFFPEGYLKMYPDVAAYEAGPWHHYVLAGKKEGRDNGLHPKFETFFPDGYLLRYPAVAKAGMNPWRHYVLTGEKEGYGNGLYRPSDEAPEERVTAYWENHRKNKKVVYTCISGEYDHLMVHGYISDDCDYICFTDNPALLRQKVYGVWQVRPLAFTGLDNTKNARWHKMHPHELFPEYEESFWVDSNINILTDYIFSLAEKSGKNFLVPRHFRNDCIYNELDFIVACRKDSAENMQVLQDLYTRENMPHRLGAPETNLLYRRHHSPDVIKIMDMWWDMILKYSSRDQASFMYVIWKNGVDPDSIFIPNLRMDARDFAFSDHREYTNSYSLLNIQKYKKTVDDHDVILFDVSGTLLVMPYLRASDLFMHLEETEHMTGFARARTDAEEAVRGAAGQDGVTLDLIYSRMADEYKPMEKLEKDFVLRVSQPHPVIKELYDYALKRGKRVIAVQDSYYPEEFLKELLDKAGYHDPDSIIVSGVKNEGSGDRLTYAALLDMADCSPSSILHIGNGPSACAEESSGIDSLLIEKISDHLFKINSRAKAFFAECRGSLDASIYLGIMAIHSACTQEYLSREEYFENLGYEYGGVAAYQFVKFVYESCLRDNIKDIVMASKDGYTLQRVFDLFNKEKLNSHYVFVPAQAPHSSAQDQEDGTAAAETHAESGRVLSKSTKTGAGESTSCATTEIPYAQTYSIHSLSGLKAFEYADYLAQFKYGSPRLAFVALSDDRRTSEKLLAGIWPQKEITGFYWRKSDNPGEKPGEKVLDSKGESRGMLEPWDFMEVLFSSPEFRVKDIVNGKLVYWEAGSAGEQYLAENYQYISDGIVKFTEDVKRIFGEAEPDFSRLLTAYLVKTLRQNLTVSDRKYLKNLGSIAETD